MQKLSDFHLLKSLSTLDIYSINQLIQLKWDLVKIIYAYFQNLIFETICDFHLYCFTNHYTVQLDFLTFIIDFKSSISYIWNLYIHQLLTDFKISWTPLNCCFTIRTGSCSKLKLYRLLKEAISTQFDQSLTNVTLVFQSLPEASE